MTTAAILALLVFLGVVQIWHILVLSFTTGLAQAFGGPAYQSLIPSLVVSILSGCGEATIAGGPGSGASSATGGATTGAPGTAGVTSSGAGGTTKGRVP